MKVCTNYKSVNNFDKHNAAGGITRLYRTNNYGQSSKPDKPDSNLLLNRLPRTEHKRLVSQLEYVPLKLGTILYEADQDRDYVYFPTRGIVSVVQTLEEGSSSEIALIGNEGMLGITAMLGGRSQPNEAVVQMGGGAYRTPASTLREALKVNPVLNSMLLLYLQVLYTQVAQSAVCNRHHTLQQQLCRWLLLSVDCVKSDQIVMTQALIACMLGVRREGVTRAARDLQDQHLIEYHRGVITILDRPRLEKTSCECYRLIRSETDRLMAISETLGEKSG